MNEAKHPGGRPRKGRSVRVNVTRKFSPELIEAMETNADDSQSSFIENWMWQHPDLIDKKPEPEMIKCSQCENEAELMCRIGSCEPSTWWCSSCYIKRHIPEEGD